MAKKFTKKVKQVTCPICDGSGCGECSSCGDGYQACACDEPEFDGECERCDGTGQVDADPSLEETARNDEGD